MIEVTVTSLRQNLPDYLAMVERGEKLNVTVRGRVIAEIRPPATADEHIDAARERLRNSLVRYEQPVEPAIAAEEWKMNGGSSSTPMPWSGG